MRKTTSWVFCAGFALVVTVLVGTMGDGTQAQGRPDRVAAQAAVPQRPDGAGPQLQCGTPEPDPETVRIVEEFQNAFETSFVSGIKLLMLLSVYLGLFNLFPLPALDGGRLVFLGYEMVTRRRANPKIEAMVHMSGIMILGIVMILVTLNDCNVI